MTKSQYAAIHETKMATEAMKANADSIINLNEIAHYVNEKAVEAMRLIDEQALDYTHESEREYLAEQRAEIEKQKEATDLLIEALAQTRRWVTGI